MGYPRHTYSFNAWHLLWDWFRQRKKQKPKECDLKRLKEYEASGLQPEAVKRLAEQLMTTQMALEDVLNQWHHCGVVCDTCVHFHTDERCTAADFLCTGCQYEDCICKYCDGVDCWTWRGPREGVVKHD